MMAFELVKTAALGLRSVGDSARTESNSAQSVSHFQSVQLLHFTLYLIVWQKMKLYFISET